MQDSIQDSTPARVHHSLAAGLWLGATLLLAGGAPRAWNGLVEKQVFEMDDYTSRGGETIAPGWEAHGTLTANHWQWANETFDRSWADEAADAARDIRARYAIEQTLDDIAAARAEVADANHSALSGPGQSDRRGAARLPGEVTGPTATLSKTRSLGASFV